MTRSLFLAMLVLFFAVSSAGSGVALAGTEPGEKTRYQVRADHQADTPRDPDAIRAAHAEAIALARSGKKAVALDILDKLLRQHSKAAYIIFDYIAIASDLGQDRDSLRFMGQIDPESTPIYVLEALAASAYRQKQFVFAGGIYHTVLERNPQNLAARVGRQLCKAESGEIRPAEQALKELETLFPQSIEVQNALARVAVIRGDVVAERQYRDRARALKSARSITPPQVREPIKPPKKQPEVRQTAHRPPDPTPQNQSGTLTPQQRQQHRDAVRLGREGQFDSSFQTFDQLLAEVDAPEVVGDHIVVLSWAGRDTDVLSYADRIDYDATPPYVLEAMAKSARNQRQYLLAKGFYRAILRQNPNHIDAHRGLELTALDEVAAAGNAKQSLDLPDFQAAARKPQSHPEEFGENKNIPPQISHAAKPPPLYQPTSVSRQTGLPTTTSPESAHTEGIPPPQSLGGSPEPELNDANMISDAEGLPERSDINLDPKTVQEGFGEEYLYDPNAIDPATLNGAAINRFHQEAVSLARNGLTYEALSMMEELLTKTAYHQKLLYDYILMLSWTGDSDAVIGFAPRIDPSQAPDYALQALGRAARNIDRPAEARPYYQVLLERNPHNVDAMIGKALCLAEEGNTDQSLQALRKLLFLYPSGSHLEEVWSGLGYVSALAGNPSDSRYYYRQALGLNPMNREAQNALALVPTRADTTLEESTGFTPFAAETLLDETEFALSLARSGLAHQAMESVACLLEESGPVPMLSNHYLQLATQAGAHNEVLAAAAAMEPEALTPEVLLAFGHAARKLPDPNLAMDYYRLARAMRPDLIEAQAGEALVMIENGMPEQGLFLLDRLAAQYSDRIDIVAAAARASVYRPEGSRRVFAIDRFRELADQETHINLANTVGLTREEVFQTIRWVEADLGDNAELLEEERLAAVTMARTGEIEGALEILACLMDQPEPSEALVFDYMVALSWADRHREVLDLLDQIDPATAPSFVQETIAGSANQMGKNELASEIYRLMHASHPDSMDAEIDLKVQAATDRDDSEAYRQLLGLLPENPRSRRLLEALLPLTVKFGDVFHEIVCYQHLLVLDEYDLNARRGLIMAVSRMGAPDLALDILEQNDVTLMPVMKEQILGDRAASRVGWGNLVQEKRETAAERHGETDLALQMLDTNLEANEPYGQERLGEWLRAQWDALMALHQRNRPDEIIARFEALEPYHDSIPAFAKSAVAGAYLTHQQPDEARKLYREVLTANPGSFDAKIGLYYALLEGEQLGEAMDYIEDVAAFEPETRSRRGSRVRGQNRTKLEAEMMRLNAIAYEDRLATAQKGFDELYRRAPHHQGLRTRLATIYHWRGWSRKARHHYEVLYGQNPENREARKGLIHTLIALRRYDEAHRMASDYYAQFPDETDAQKLMQDWSISQGYELYSEAVSNSGPGNQVADDELVLESYLYGPNIHYWFKPFAHYRSQSATFPEGDFDFRRLGGGVLFRRHDFSASVEAHANTETYDDMGILASSEYRFDDYWSLSASLNTRSFNVSPRGRLVGIYGEEFNTGVAWRHSDNHRISAGYQILDLSDGNRRQSLGLSSRHTLYMGPRWRHFGGASLYTSKGRPIDAPYFNPGKDFSANLTTDTYFITWRRYQYKFAQRLVLDYGIYDQEGYPVGQTGVLRYEHQWDLLRNMGLLYGYSRARRYYDGNPEYSTSYHATLNWRF